jgi:transcriptional regulator
VLIHPWDAATAAEALAFVRAQPFGTLVAAGRGRDVPVVVPTQFLLVDDETVLLHLARPNPVWKPIEENPAVVLSLAGDWSYIPAAWKAIGDEDPTLGVPTTYYAAVQLICEATVIDEPDAKLDLLRRQLADVEAGSGVADPEAHRRRLNGIRGLRLAVRELRGKFKYGGNVDLEHRLAVAERLAARGGPGDDAARAHLLRRTESGPEPSTVGEAR